MLVSLSSDSQFSSSDFGVLRMTVIIHPLLDNLNLNHIPVILCMLEPNIVRFARFCAQKKHNRLLYHIRYTLCGKGGEDWWTICCNRDNNISA